MNREIKFRNAFLHKDGYFSHFDYWGAIDHKGEASLNDSCFVSPSHSNGLSRQWHQQYTGLKDKNGKEIYEGDILKTNTDKPMIIGWSKMFASFVLNREGWMFSHWFGESCNPEDCEIIGNIYENPELINL